MTREEAIDLLDNLIGMIEDNHNSDYDKALKMAIETLKKEPCEDAISRSDVDNVLYESWHDINIVDDSGYFIYKDSMDIIEKLPSVYPKEKVGKWIYDGDVTRCSNCKRAYDILFTGSNYCPNCGAKMEVEE